MTRHRRRLAADYAEKCSSLDTNFLLYDGDCPACSAYVAMARLRQLYPNLRIVSARTQPDLAAGLRPRGYEINDGMVLSLDGKVYYAAEATRMIAIPGQDSPSRWRRKGLGIIGTVPWPGPLYPRLNRGRLLLLRILGRGRIG